MTFRIFAALLMSVLCSNAQGSRGSADPMNAVPKGAKQVSPGVYRHVDSAGKAWLYRNTPFGYSKVAEDTAAEKANREPVAGERVTPFGTSTTEQSQPLTKDGKRATPFGNVAVKDAGQPTGEAASNDSALITAKEQGDSIRFERPSPFGKYSWQRKKSELTEDEKRIWERSQQKASASTPGQSK